MAVGTRDVLFELGTEELPPRALPELERALAEHFLAGLQAAGIPHGAMHSFAAPRRLALLVESVAERQPDQNITRRGPPVSAAFDAAGAPTRAAHAFADSCGVTLESLTRIKEGKGEFLFFSGRQAGAETSTLLPGLLRAALDALPIPKRMRWGASEAEFVRPVHWVVLRFGAEVVPARLLDTESGGATRGHRFHSPGEIVLPEPADYARVLRESGHVLASFGERRERVLAQVTACAVALGGRAVMDEQLLDEVTALVEWPVALAGRFDERFLALPREVLLSTLQAHQRYFAVESAAGALLPWFITVSNLESREPERVREGNERVVRPRLSDAAFFHEQDRRSALVSRREALDQVTFQTRLGSIGDKVCRVETLAAELAALIGGDVARARRAAMLCKCDLLTAMVGEFPDLQGVMGAYYATADGEDAEVATALREHYQPRGAGDALPATPTGIALALADKLDTLAGIFGIGQKPSGTKDPFALRRAAIGVLRILLEHRLELDLRVLVELAVAGQPVKQPSTASEVLDYILDRLRAHALELGHASERFDAVHAVGITRPLDFMRRLEALGRFLSRPEADSLTAANKRIANILKKSLATGADSASASVSIDPARLVHPAEKALHGALDALDSALQADLAAARYDAALARLAELRGVIDAFFADVMVNDPDVALRANRLALVGRVQRMFAGVADLSRLPG